MFLKRKYFKHKLYGIISFLTYNKKYNLYMFSKRFEVGAYCYNLRIFENIYFKYYPPLSLCLKLF